MISSGWSVVGNDIDIRQELIAARNRLGWSQAELARRAGIQKASLSRIESGKIVPRVDSLLNLVRVLEHDLIIVPRALVPAVLAMARGDGERPLYAVEDDDHGGHEGGDDAE